MELSFAVGNMIGDKNCQTEDWDQLKDILNGWECSTRGDAKDARENMQNLVGDAKKACAASATDTCPESFCVDLFEVHEQLVQSLNVYDVSQVGTGKRGPIPPKVKGPVGIGRTGTLLGQRQEEMRRAKARQDAQDRADAELKAQKAAEREAEREARRQTSSGDASSAAARHHTPMRGMSGGGSSDERRKRWYPEKSIA
jgi:Spy/CpxP family protein refolding chaperone